MVKSLRVTALKHCVPAVQADAVLLRTKDTQERPSPPGCTSWGGWRKLLWVPSCVGTWWSMLRFNRRYPCFLKGKDIRRIDLRGNVYWLPDRGSRQCSRKAHARMCLVRGQGNRGSDRRAGLAGGQGDPWRVLLIDHSESRGTECLNRSRKACSAHPGVRIKGPMDCTSMHMFSCAGAEVRVLGTAVSASWSRTGFLTQARLDV